MATAEIQAEIDHDEASAIEALRDPRGLLVDALVRIRQADTFMFELTGSPAVAEIEQAMYRVESAKAVTAIATAAANFVAGDVNVVVDGPDGAGFEAPARVAHTQPPMAVEGVRFDAILVGRKLGLVGNVPWLWVRRVGFIGGHDGLFAGGHLNDDGDYVVPLSGRIVSSTPEQALCVTDGGMPVALPHDMIVPMSEEDR